MTTVIYTPKNGPTTTISFPKERDPFEVLEGVLRRLGAKPPEKDDRFEAVMKARAERELEKGRASTAPSERTSGDAEVDRSDEWAESDGDGEGLEVRDFFLEPARVTSTLSATSDVLLTSAPVPPRPGVRDTSMSAYRHLEWSGKMSKQQKIVVDFFVANPGRRFTRQELSKALGLGINAVCGRVNELLAEPMMILRENGRKKCEVTQNDVNALELG